MRHPFLLEAGTWRVSGDCYGRDGEKPAVEREARIVAVKDGVELSSWPLTLRKSS